jgi:hypothetical protein
MGLPDLGGWVGKRLGEITPPSLASVAGFVDRPAGVGCTNLEGHWNATIQGSRKLPQKKLLAL